MPNEINPPAQAGTKAKDVATLKLAALKVSITQLDKKENPIGSNWGEPVKTYLASVGITFPASWCMAFVYWCFKVAANDLGIDNPAIKTGGVLNAWNLGKSFRGEPIVGSVFIIDFGKGLGHTGIVEKLDKDFIWTVEGNTNDTGSREGFEVCRRKRARKAIKGYLNY